MNDRAQDQEVVSGAAAGPGLAWTPPASFLQEQWFNSTTSRLSNYNVAVAWSVTGKLDRGALQQALGELTVRHEILRTSLGEGGGGVRQLVRGFAEPPLWRVDLSGTESPEAELHRLVLSNAAQPFALREPPLWRAILARLGPGAHVLALILHHALCDGWSGAILHRDLVSLYQGCVAGTRPCLPEMAIQFGDYAAWEQSFRDPALEAAWCGRLTPRPSSAAIPFSEGLDRRPFDLICHPLPSAPPGTAGRLLEAARQQRATLATAVYTAALMTLMPGAGAGTEIVVGIAHANRGALEVQQLIGPVFDYVPLRIRTDGEPDFAELLRRVRDEEAAARDRRVPLRCVERAVAERDGGVGRGLFDIIFNFIPSPRNAAAQSPRSPAPGSPAPDSPAPGSPAADARFAPCPLPNNWMRIRADRDFYGAGRLSYVVRSEPSGEIAGHLYGHGDALPWHRLAQLGATFSATLAAAGENPGLRPADLRPAGSGE